MSNEHTPLVSDRQLEGWCGTRAETPMPPEEVRDIYEAARQQDAATIAALRARIMDRPTAKWTSAEVKMPERGDRILAWGETWVSVGMCFFGTCEDYRHYCHADGDCKEVTWRWCEDGATVRNANVTHWMPLPEPPSDS